MNKATMLTLEDILNTAQRPKAEMFEEYLYVVLKMLKYDEEKGIISIDEGLDHHRRRREQGDLFSAQKWL